MKYSIITTISFVLLAHWVTAQSQDEIRLLVRGDDIGSFTSANHACIDSVKNGIVRSLELMVPCAWLPEAVKLLNENPTIDVGVHLTITSEWTNNKWRPLTHAPSLTDEYGYFYPYIWAKRDEPNRALQETEWKLAEIEAEFRAQIEMAKKCVPHVSHITDHMGCAGWNNEVRAMVQRLAVEYDLYWGNPQTKAFPRMNANSTDPAEKRVAAFIEALGQLEPGNTYMFVEHPAYDTPEMRRVGHLGYEHVAQDRDGVTTIFTDSRVINFIKQKGIRLVSYADVIEEAKIQSTNDTPKPNILWITAEDLSPTLGCYGDAYAVTPNLDRLASQSLRYAHCWSNAPVCAPARTALLMGMYPTALGGHHMRSDAPIPPTLKPYPLLLREA
ncbi:MAG: ChbG/HpnK family deacetylase, partial [Planctomycetaceae bacterium]|nr:ChbG/HpnK family deacetylase [Planctomycetaceae bacterium]